MCSRVCLAVPLYLEQILYVNVTDGEVVVGKITYCSSEILGHGSEGTMVFK